MNAINALQMQHIQENVCTHFGTNMDILQNKFDENTWNAYYEGKIEPFAIQLSLVMTNMSFTEISARNFANRSYEQEKQELLKRRAMILKIKASL